jgi:Transglycosylase SLT domain
MANSVIVGSSPYENMIQNASQKYGVPANLIKAVIKQESGGKSTAVSGKGAGGLMQLMPATARGLGVSNVYDPAQNIDGGTRYLAQKIKDNNGSIPLALAAYNAGQGRVNQAGGKIPNIPETQNYVSSIMSMYGGGNVDLSAISDGSGNSFDIGGNIVNGIQNIFQTLFTDTTRIVIYIILFGLMIFFGYKALQGSPPANAAGFTAKKVIKTAIKVIPK